MGYRDAARDQEPTPTYNPSACHFVTLREMPVNWVQMDGSELKIGRAWYCPYEDWKFKKKFYCLKLAKLFKNRNWPESLEVESFRKLCDLNFPGYWLSGGYHVYQHKYSWHNLRSFDYLVPSDSRSDLTPLARAIIQFRNKSPNLSSVDNEPIRRELKQSQQNSRSKISNN